MDVVLSESQRRALDNDGYLLFPGVIDAHVVAQLRGRFDAVTAPRESGTRHSGDLLDDDVIVKACTPPVVLAAAEYTLGGPVVLKRLHGRDPLAGYGRQGLHVDWVCGGPVAYVFTCLAYLDDFYRENGATRIVPGTHRRSAVPDRRAADPAFVHAGEIVVEGPAGTVLAFNGHVWHSATLNASGKRRRAFQYLFERVST